MQNLKSRLLYTAMALSLLVPFLSLSTGQTYGKALRLRMEPRVSVAGLRTEYKQDPLGIDVTRPRLSWQLQSLQVNDRGVTQSAYQVRVGSSARGLQIGRNLVWDSGQVQSSDSIQQSYGGPP